MTPQSFVPTLPSLPPGARGLPWIGETVEWVRDPFQFAQDRYMKYGPVFRTHLIGRPCVVMLGPDANRFILSSHTQHFSSREGWGYALTSLIGDGLSVIDGAQHRRHRRMIQPALHGAMLQRYFETMYSIAVRHIDTWSQKPEVRLFDAFKELSFEIACELLLGARDDAGKRGFYDQFHRFTGGLFALPAWRLPGTAYGKAWRAGRALRQTLHTLITERRAVPGHDILSMLIAAVDEEGRGFADAELVDELLVLLWAGHDTVTSLLTWATYELLRHPEIADRAIAEQLVVAPDGALTLPQLLQLPVLDRCLREAERLHPPAPGGIRGVVAPFEYGGYTIPAGWTVMYSIVWTHQSPELWPEPTRFDPDRFAPPREEGKRPFHLIGFGGGPRICVGLAFAQMQMRIVLSHLLRTCRLELLPGQDFAAVAVPTRMPRDRLRVRCIRA